MSPDDARRVAQERAFPHGLGEWEVSGVQPLLARLDGGRWKYSYGIERVARDRTRASDAQREGWIVMFRLPDLVDGRLVDFFPAVVHVRVFTDGLVEVE